MLTKTRTTLITLIAAASFATSTTAPAVSQAEDNSYAHAVACEQMRQETETLRGQAYVASLLGRKDLAAHYSEAADEIEQAAAENECHWAWEKIPDAQVQAKLGALEHGVTVTPLTKPSRPVAVKVPTAKVSKVSSTATAKAAVAGEAISVEGSIG